MTSDSNYAVRPPSGQEEVSHPMPVNQTGERLLDRTARRSKRDPRRGKRPAAPSSGGPAAPSPAAPQPDAQPGAAPTAGEGDDEHVDYYI
jgi:hypothetical protein